MPAVRLIDSPVPLANTTDRAWRQGWLYVPENRLAKNANTIELPFIFSLSNDSLKNGPPVLIMSGGPGNSSLHMANGVVNTPWGRTRDVLVMEQRGTKQAKPALNCPEIDSMRILGLKQGLWGAALDSMSLAGTKACYDRLINQSVDLNGYNTLESTADMEALRQALQLDQLILYGMSYSCNLMTAYAQQYPEHVAGMILDSPLPHHTHYDSEAYQNIDSTLKQIIGHYTGNAQLYTDWTNYIYTVQDSLFTLSLDGQAYPYTKNHLIDLVLFKMSDHSSIPATASTISQIINGDHSGIDEVVQYYASPTGQAKGMRYAVWMGEEWPEEEKSRIERQGKIYPWLAGYPANDFSAQTARIWKVNSIYTSKQWPVTPFDGPTLILSGQFDPWTPVWYGMKMFTVVPNAEHLVYPERTHLPGFTSQGMEDIEQFMNGLRK